MVTPSDSKSAALTWKQLSASAALLVSLGGVGGVVGHQQATSYEQHVKEDGHSTMVERVNALARRVDKNEAELSKYDKKWEKLDDAIGEIQTNVAVILAKLEEKAGP